MFSHLFLFSMLILQSGILADTQSVAPLIIPEDVFHHGFSSARNSGTAATATTDEYGIAKRCHHAIKDPVNEDAGGVATETAATTTMNIFKRKCEYVAKNDAIKVPVNSSFETFATTQDDGAVPFVTVATATTVVI